MCDCITIVLSGSMTNVSLLDGDGMFADTPPGDIAIAARFDGSRNFFSGTTSVTSFPNNVAAMTANASGAIAGRFFGPSAQEIGAVWTLSDGVRQMIGSFGAKIGN